MPAHKSTLLDSDGITEFALSRWQELDRGWKAALLGIAIVLRHLLRVVT